MQNEDDNWIDVGEEIIDDELMKSALMVDFETDIVLHHTSDKDVVILSHDMHDNGRTSLPNGIAEYGLRGLTPLDIQREYTQYHRKENKRNKNKKNKVFDKRKSKQ